MPRSVLTVSDVEAIAEGCEIVVSHDTIVTALARDEAARRNITIKVQGAKPPTSAGVASSRVVALGADHGGFDLKEQLKEYLREWGYTALDLGTSSREAVDYPDFAEAVANAVVRGDA